MTWFSCLQGLALSGSVLPASGERATHRKNSRRSKDKQGVGLYRGSMSQPPAWLRSAQDSWSNRGQSRPDFADPTEPGQESVWDYPRPPVISPDQRRVTVAALTGDQRLIADTNNAVRVLETASPPTFYLPRVDVDIDALVVVEGSSFCEWKGPARYYALAAAETNGGRPAPVAWDYPTPFESFATIAGHVSFYPALVRCTVDDEVVEPQEGGFYGGWVTSEIVGPYKGQPGTGGW